MRLESLHIAARGLRANRLRSALTILGILIGVGAVILLVAVGNGSSATIRQRIEGLGTNTLTVFRRGRPTTGTQGSSQNLTFEDVKALQDQTVAPDLRYVVPVVNSSVTASANGLTYSPGQFVGTTPEYADVRNYKIGSGQMFTSDDVTDHSRVAVIGTTVADNLFPGQDPIGQQVQFNTATYRIIGVLQSKGTNGLQDQDDVVLAPYTAVQDTLTGYTGTVSNITIQAASLQQMDAAANEVTSVLYGTHHVTSAADAGFQVLNQATLLDTSNAASQVFTVLLGAVAAISLLVGGIGVMNIMLVTVTERTHEIGIRKAIGATNRDILTQFLNESILLALVGGITGVLAGIGLSTFRIAGVKPIVSPWSVALAFGVSLAVGLFFGIYPANRAATLTPIEALRHE